MRTVESREPSVESRKGAWQLRRRREMAEQASIAKTVPVPAAPITYGEHLRTVRAENETLRQQFAALCAGAPLSDYKRLFGPSTLDPRPSTPR